MVYTKHVIIFPCGAGQPLVANNSSNSGSADSVRQQKQEPLANFFLGVKMVCLFVHRMVNSGVVDISSYFSIKRNFLV